MWGRSVEDDYEATVDVRQVCQGCGTRSKRVIKGECHRCADPVAAELDDNLRAVQARRKGYLQTASYLRRHGWHGEAEWFEGRVR